MGFDNSSLISTQISLSFAGGSTNPNCNVFSITSTQIVCSNLGFTEIGVLLASIISFGGSSGNPTVIATIVPQPTITTSTSKLAKNSQFLTIFGMGFDDSSLISTQISLSFDGGSTNPNCDIFSITSNQIVCLNLGFTEIGVLFASVISFGGSSGNPTVIATIVPQPTITISSSKLAKNSQFLTIFGMGFDNSSLISTQISLSFAGGSTNPNCDIFSITSNQIVCLNLGFTEVGVLIASIISFGGSS